MRRYPRATISLLVLCVLLGAGHVSCSKSHWSWPKKSYDDWSEQKKRILENETFPGDFVFGVVTSAYQVEGAWNLDGKGESVWDHLTHTNPSIVKDGKNADVSADFYHKYKEDIRLAKGIGSQMFKISLSWTRILPNGYGTNVNKDGIAYYKDVINEIISNDMIPMVALLHHDIPNHLQNWGGMLNSLFVDWFAEYARLAFSIFGSRVKHWVTINEPDFVCSTFYGSDTALIANDSGKGIYYCGHHALLAHAAAYRLYEQEFRDRQRGKVGIVLRYRWFEGMNLLSDEDNQAVENAFVWHNHWLTNPIFGRTGDYPAVMRRRIDLKSRLQGFSESRLPRFTKDEIKKVKDSADFIGISCWPAFALVRRLDRESGSISFDDDANIIIERHWKKYAPWSIREILQRINIKYTLPDIFITESGYADEDQYADLNKTVYHRNQIFEALQCMRSGINIRGYLVRSLLDGFEWTDGYELKYGVFQVDFESPNRTRTPRISSVLLKKVFNERKLHDTLHFLMDVLSKQGLN